MDLIFSDCFRRNEPGVFSEIPDVPLACSDYMPLADLTSCLQANQPTTKLYADPDAWAKFCAGEQKAVGALVGAVMKTTKGKADGKAVTALLQRRRG